MEYRFINLVSKFDYVKVILVKFMNDGKKFLEVYISILNEKK